MKIRIATRNSPWALAATESVIRLARAQRPDVEWEMEPVLSPGDVQDGDLAKLGGTTIFVDALSKDIALGRVDAAVHTAKDVSWPKDIANFPLGTLCPNGLRTSGNLIVAATTKRVDSRDAFVLRRGETMDSLRHRPVVKVGTSSRLRAAAFRNLFPDKRFQLVPIRGSNNVRLDMLDNGEFDLLILSMDGLTAMSLVERATSIIEEADMPPALTQAIGVVEVAEQNTEAVAVINSISNADSMNCLRAEWAFMRAAEVTCNTPVGGRCLVAPNGTLSMWVKMLDPQGKAIDARLEGYSPENPEGLGRELANLIMQHGAKEVETAWNNVGTPFSQDAC